MAVLVQRDFSGGLINAADPLLLQRNQLQVSDGADVSKPGLVRPKKGWAKLHTTGLPVAVNDLFFQNIFSTKGLIARAGSRLYALRPHIISANLGTGSL
jgi:hypothetical protein